jgi:hypothetical protein
MAQRVPGWDVRGMQQFVNQSSWFYQQVRASLARKVEKEFVPEAVKKFWIDFANCPPVDPKKHCCCIWALALPAARRFTTKKVRPLSMMTLSP